MLRSISILRLTIDHEGPTTAVSLIRNHDIDACSPVTCNSICPRHDQASQAHFISQLSVKQKLIGVIRNFAVGY